MLNRAFRLLEAFGPRARTLSLAELSRRSGIPKSSALRIATRLVELGALERRENGDFVVGLRLLEIASLAPRGHGLRTVALPHMEDLHHVAREHVLLAVRDGRKAVLVERLSAHGAAEVLYRVGGRLPLTATGVGLCLLAHAPVAFQDEVLSDEAVIHAERSPLSVRELRRELAEIRRGGVAVVTGPNPVSGNTTPMASVAAPIIDGEGEVIAAVSVVAPQPKADVIVLRTAVMTIARVISRALRSE
jgi:DNA-binding IclR family transcriptional regulator